MPRSDRACRLVNKLPESLREPELASGYGSVTEAFFAAAASLAR